MLGQFVFPGKCCGEPKGDLEPGQLEVVPVQMELPLDRTGRRHDDVRAKRRFVNDGLRIVGVAGDEHGAGRGGRRKGR